ncbi:hypothetical protein CRG98_008170 [Punica granatum]|uniref:Uncharacterized protein n=1 Tax=Punica granatum TaxID=22663 RepID=A0A2I0KSZ2_PUNGR|nr:hypothetical protein CRG98_008170 [Punica granatum]
MEMKENQAFEAYATERRGKAAKHIPPISEIQQVQLFHSTLKGVYYLHLLSHASSFFELIEAGKKLDMGIKLGRIEGPISKKKGEASRKQAAGTSRRPKDATISAVNPGHQPPQQFPTNYEPAPSATQAYARPVHYLPPYQPQQTHYSSPPFIIQPQLPHQQAPVQSRASTSRPSQPAQRAPPPQTRQGSAASSQ